MTHVATAILITMLLHSIKLDDTILVILMILTIYLCQKFIRTYQLFLLSSMQLRRERIAERMKALQELVPSANKVSAFSVQLIIASLFIY